MEMHSSLSGWQSLLKPIPLQHHAHGVVTHVTGPVQAIIMACGLTMLVLSDPALG